MILTREDIVLRPFRPDDRERLHILADNPAVIRFMTDEFPHPYPLEEADRWIALTMAEKRRCNFGVEWNGELIGGIGLTPMADMHSGTTNMGYWLGEPYWGRGLAVKAVAALLPYAFDELLFIRVQALVLDANHRSMRVLEKSGFTKESIMRKHVRKHGIVSDAALFAKLRNE